MSPRPQRKGSIALVALCFVAVMGISLASYLAISNQAMKLSNRSFQTGVSEQLAESGLEEGLRAFNSNNWATWTSGGTTATWSLGGASANCTITYPAAKFGPGIVGTVKIRVDNYNAASLPATWSSTANYRINDLVGGSNGMWFRSVKNANLNNDPTIQTTLAWWAPAPIPWAWNSNTPYTINYDVVCNGGTWYRCATSHTSGTTFAVGTNWTVIPAPGMAWDNATAYAVNAFVFSNGVWYRCTSAHTNHVPPNATYWAAAAPNFSWAWNNATAYAFNDLVFYSASGAGTWYRCIAPHTNQLPTNTSYWENALTGSWAWASSDVYNLNDVVCSGSTLYRCILAHTNHAPPNATYWSTAPRLSPAWDPGRQYSTNDTAFYNGVWYLSLQNSNFGQNPATATTWWQSTATAATQWNPATAYAVGNYASYGGVWYKCLSAGTNKSPNNSTYWSASWVNSSGATTGTPVAYAEGSVTLPDGSTVIKTQLRATLALAPLFPNAVAATTTISANAGGTVDSYDSTAGTYASQVATATNFSAVVAAGSTAGTAITLSSTAVQGYIAAPSGATSPYAPLFSSGGSVKGFTSPGSPNIDLTRLSRSPSIPQFDPQPAGGLAANWASTPNGTALVLAATTDIGTPGATTPSRYYYNGTLTLGSASASILRINGPVILYINGDLVITASGTTGRIDISTSGSAEIHVAGGFKADAGGEGILNATTDPHSVIIICDTATNAAQFYSEGIDPFYGAIYAPNTTNANGYYNDNTGTNIYGAVSAKKITYSGANLNVHYDTSLRYYAFGGIDQPYTVAEWRELTDPSERASLP